METSTQPSPARPPEFHDGRNRRQKARAAGLHPDYWYAVEYDRALKPGQVIEVRFWNSSIALYRSRDGRLHALENRCAHRQLKLSIGQVEGGNLTCAYHGWSYDGNGCVVNVAHDLFGHPRLNIRIRSYPVRSRYGLIWIFPGDPARAEQRQIPDIPELEGPQRWACVPLDFTWRAHHSMIIDNVSDFTHAYLHRRYKPFVDPKMTKCEAADDRVSLAYETQIGMGRVTGLFVDRKRVDTNFIELCYEYPYQWSSTGGGIKHWCFLLPLDAGTTRAFFLFYFNALRIPFTPLRIPRFLMTPLLKIANRLHIKPLLDQDGFAVEAEQAGYEAHYAAPMIEINPAIGLFQDLTIRKWEEYLAKTDDDPAKERGLISIIPEKETAPRQGGSGAEDAWRRALDHLLALQHQDGCWEGEMVWCTMILSQVVIVRRIVGKGWDELTRARIIRHYEVTRTGEGVWGLHPESGGYVFTTTLAYVALRLLGLGADHPLLVPARHWLHRQPGGALAIPTWGKFWLALLDLYDYEGINPSPPELFLLPRWLPFHPYRYYCHTRYIYLAISSLYGQRFKANLGTLRDELRLELYTVPFETIDFARQRHVVAATDLHVRPAAALRLAYDLLAFYERCPIGSLRRRALDYCFKHVLYEQQTSRYEGLSPVNGLLNCLVLWARSGDNPDLRRSLDGVESWKWEDDEEGVRYAGARSHTWDTAFAIQAIAAEPSAAQQAEGPLRRAYGFLSDSQLTAEVPMPKQEGRDSALGGWCFSNGRHRWPVSDCTAEALSAILALHALFGPEWPGGRRIPDVRLRQALAFILQRQNRDGGFGTYERHRGSALLEAVNPSEMFGRCMTERSYLECTGSALAALAHFRSAYPQVMNTEVSQALERAVRFLRRSQRADGAFPGFWGINFTYGTYHVVHGLRAVGLARTDPTLERAANWLTGKQRADGGWGEHYSGCLKQSYVEHTESQVVMTSWALLALLEVLPPAAGPIARGLEWLRTRQRPDGSWAGRSVNGVFFGTAMLDYRLYPAYFPTWALARHAGLTSARA